MRPTGLTDCHTEHGEGVHQGNVAVWLSQSAASSGVYRDLSKELGPGVLTSRGSLMCLTTGVTTATAAVA